MLGLDVSSAAAATGHDVHGFSRGELDVTDRDAVDATIGRLHPDAVINCAAYTDVDGAEAAEPAANAVNGDGAGNVARAAAAAGAWTVHVSSDYVFAGTRAAPYVESDATGPESAYGRSKLAGELAVAQAAPDAHTIVRTAWLFGAGGRCFPRTIIRTARERDELTVVDDQVGCPTFTGHLADALVELAVTQLPGIVHVAAAGECSWYEFAAEIVSVAGIACELVPGRSADLDRPAPRPAYSVLRSERGPSVPELPDWHEGLAAFMTAQVAPA
jgi:dTDP-4-dehydrorhamnose reductase